MDAPVELIEVSRRYGAAPGRLALRGVSLAVPAGSFVAVMGATGSGKSTLLHCAAGLDRPTSGTVRLAGRDLCRMRERPLTLLRRDRVGVVFQSYNLLSGHTVQQNVLLPVRLGAPRRRSAADVLALVGLTGQEQRPVGALSGGEQQRVAIARALVTDPIVVFADEPTGALDPTTGARILRLLRNAVDRDGLTVVLVTHEPTVAAVSDRLVLLQEGRIVADGATPGTATITARLRAVCTDRSAAPA